MIGSTRLPINEVSSLAYRDGEHVHVRLHLADTGWQPGPVPVRLVTQDRRFRAEGVVSPADDGVRLEVALPVRRLRRDVWSFSVQSAPDAPFVRLQVRLLAKPGRPVALLPGPWTKLNLAAPLPRAAAAPAASFVSRAARRLRRLVREKLR